MTLDFRNCVSIFTSALADRMCELPNALLERIDG